MSVNTTASSNSANIPDSALFGFLTKEKWEETAKTIVFIAAFSILPIETYVESGALLAIAIAGLEVTSSFAYNISSY